MPASTALGPLTFRPFRVRTNQEFDMKLVATFAAVALACCLTGCASKQSTAAAPGAVNGEKACCAEGAAKGAACCKEGEKKAAAPGAVNGGSCCKDAKAAAPGAVSGSGCCKAGASGCTAK